VKPDDEAAAAANGSVLVKPLTAPEVAVCSLTAVMGAHLAAPRPEALTAH
jgi:hypothetical protein